MPDVHQHQTGRGNSKSAIGLDAAVSMEDVFAPAVEATGSMLITGESTVTSLPLNPLAPDPSVLAMPGEVSLGLPGMGRMASGIPGVRITGVTQDVDAARNGLDALMASGMDMPVAIAHMAALHGRDVALSLWNERIVDIPRSRSNRTVDMLYCMAEADPVLATDFLNDGLACGRIGAALQLTMVTDEEGNDQWVDPDNIPDDILDDEMEYALNLDDGEWVTRLDGLPSHIEGHFWMSGCEALVLVGGASLRVDGGVACRDCPALEALPDDLEALSLDLSNSKAFRTLPSRLVLEGELDLRGCASWDGRIPDGSKVGQVVTNTHKYPGISLDEWRKIHPHGERG